MLPGYTENISCLNGRLNLLKEKVYDLRTVNRGRHRKHCIKNYRNSHDHKTDTLPPHRLPQTFYRFSGLFGHLKLHLVCILGIFILSHIYASPFICDLAIS